MTLTYPDTEVVTYTYNGMGDVESIAWDLDPDSGYYVADVDYNSAGQITHIAYGNGITSQYTYDSETLRLQRIQTWTPAPGAWLQDLSYTFDANGNVTAIDDTVNDMSQDFTYDDLNRLTQAIGSAYGTQSFVYDAIGNMTSKAGRAMAYGEGAPGPHAVTTVSWTGTNFPSFCRDLASGSCALGYDANGNMTTRGGDVLSYDSENRLKEIKTYEGESGTTNYTLKPGWNVIAFTHLPDNRSVSNVLSSLTFGTDYDQVSTWDEATDTWKHWVNDSDFNDFTQFEYGKTYEIYNNSGSDKALSVTGKTASMDITHSIVAGDNFISPAVKSAVNVSTVLSCLTQGTHYSDVKRFNAGSQVWESYASSQFTQFEPGKGYIIVGLTNASFAYGKTETTTTFVYDSTGARVKKTAAGTASIYLGKDYDMSGSLTTKYVFLGDRRIANKDSNGTTLYYHEDHISSSNVITDSSGNQAAMYEYDPYGSTVTHTGSASVKHQFTGQEKDDSTGLHYYNARYYDSQLGRFITADPTIQHPTDPQDFNRYAYARNNPIRFTDPTGLGWLSAIFAVIGAAIGYSIGGPIGAVIGGAIGGALGATADAAIAKENLGKAAIRGAIQGAVTGAMYAVGAGGGGGEAGSSSISAESTVALTESGEAAIQAYPILEPVVTETASPLIPNIIGGTIAAGASTASRELSGSNRSSANADSGEAVSWQKALDGIVQRVAGSGPGMPFSDLPTGGGAPPATGGSYALAGVPNGQASFAVDLARINSGGILLRGEDGGKSGKRSWFGKLFGKNPKGLLNRWTWLRIGVSWKGTRLSGKDVFRVASGGEDEIYHLHIDFEKDGIKTNIKWRG